MAQSLARITKMEQIIVRKAISTDLPILLEFEQGVIQAERPFDKTLRDGDDLQYYDLKGMVDADHVQLLVAVAGAEIVGSGYARIEASKSYLRHKQHAYLGFMFVRPDFRGFGVNKLIIDGLKNWCNEKGITELRLDVYDQNSAAIKAYEKVGFKKHMIEMRFGLED